MLRNASQVRKMYPGVQSLWCELPRVHDQDGGQRGSHQVPYGATRVFGGGTTTHHRPKSAPTILWRLVWGESTRVKPQIIMDR